MVSAYVKQGWSAVRSQLHLVIVLFVYQLIWGIYLSKFLQSIVVPLLHRYPGDDVSAAAKQLYFAEGHFQLVKTNIAHSTLWLLLGLLAARMLLTPLIEAGLYYSVHHADQKRRFRTGISRLWKTFCLLYVTRIVLMAAPLFWLVPKAIEVAVRQRSYEEMALALLPYIASWWLYSCLLSLVFMYVQFGKISGDSGWRSLFVVARHIVPVTLVSVFLFCIAAAAAVSVFAVTMVWAGFVAVVLHQLYYLVRTVFNVWEIGAQHRLWVDKAQI